MQTEHECLELQAVMPVNPEIIGSDAVRITPAQPFLRHHGQNPTHVWLQRTAWAPNAKRHTRPATPIGWSP